MNEDTDYLHFFLLFTSIDGFMLNSIAQGQDFIAYVFLLYNNCRYIILRM